MLYSVQLAGPMLAKCFPTNRRIRLSQFSPVDNLKQHEWLLFFFLHNIGYGGIVKKYLTQYRVGGYTKKQEREKWEQYKNQTRRF